MDIDVTNTMGQIISTYKAFDEYGAVLDPVLNVVIRLHQCALIRYIVS